MNENNKKILLWLIPIAGIMSLHFWAYAGHFGFDDMAYARIAKELLDGKLFLDNDHYAFRWTIVTLTALSYKLFGINDFASAIPAWIITFLTLSIVNQLTKGYSWVNRLIAACIFSFHFWTLFYADKLMPDCYIALSVLASFYVYYRHRFELQGKGDIQSGILFSLSIWFGLLSKESMVLIVPIYAFLFFSDILQKRPLRFWIYAVISMIILSLLYFGLTAYLTGNSMQRWVALQAGSYDNACSYDKLPLINTLRRIGYELWITWIRSGAVIGILLGILPLLKFKFKDIIRLENRESFFPLITLLCVLAAQYSSIVPNAYVPMCPDVRHFLYIAPLAAIGSHLTISDFWNNRRFGWILLSFSIFFTFISLYNNYEWTYWLYIPLSILVILRMIPSLFPFLSEKKHLFAWILIVILYLPVIQNGFYQRTLHFKQRPIAIKVIFDKSKEQNIAIGNLVMCNLGKYYLHYDTSYTKFTTYKELNLSKAMEPGTQIYIMDDWLTEYLSNTDRSKCPLYLQKIDTSFAEKLYDYKDMKIWKVKDKAKFFELAR